MKNKAILVTAAMLISGLCLTSSAQDTAQKFSAPGNYCTRSSGGTFASDVDGGIGNSSATEAMIVHCPIYIFGAMRGQFYALDRHSSQNIDCTVQGRPIVTGGAGQGSNIRADVLATGSTSGSPASSAVALVATNIPVNNNPPWFNAFSNGWVYLRCAIPPVTSLGTSVLKGYYFYTAG